MIQQDHHEYFVSPKAMQRTEEGDFDGESVPGFFEEDVPKRRATVPADSNGSTPSKMLGFQRKRSRFGMLSSSSSSLSSSSSSQSDSSFDMGELWKASRRIEETMTCPSHEWSSFHHHDYNDENDEDRSDFLSTGDDTECYLERPGRKRQCRGLTRCDRSCNLLSLWKMSANLERKGSSGSLA